MGHRDKEWLEDRYWRDGFGIPEIARIAGVCQGTIQYWMKKHGIPTRGRKDALYLRHEQRLQDKKYTDPSWLERKYWEEGFDTYQIAEMIGVASSTIIRWMQRLGIPRRSKSEAGQKNWNENPDRRERFSEGIKAAWERGVFDAPEYRETISRKAKARWDAGYYDMEKHPRWLGGKSFEPYPIQFNDKFKEMIRERDGRRCVLCGKGEQENGRRLSVHHITYDKNNLDPDLKVSLCDSCHMKTNTNRAFWTAVFTRFWRRAPVADWQRRQVVL